MKTIILERPLTVNCWRVIGRVAKTGKRDELRPLLLRAQEIGVTNATDIAAHLLFEAASRRVVAARLLQIAENLRLLKQHGGGYVLTDDGLKTLETKQVLIPEDGTWTIWASEDPLLATPILRIEPWTEPRASDELIGKKRDDTKRTVEKLPPWLHGAVGVVVSPAAGDGEVLRIDELKPDGEAVTPETKISAIWDVSERRLRLAGTLDGSTVDTALVSPNVTRAEAWRQLLEAEGIWPLWDTTRQVMRLRFKDTRPDERQSMRRSITFQRPVIAALGPFAPARVEHVALSAASAQDAEEWAKWRLEERIRTYATAERFAEWQAQAVEAFDDFQPNVPTRRDFTEKVKHSVSGRPSALAWHLMAAEDWGL